MKYIFKYIKKNLRIGFTDKYYDTIEVFNSNLNIRCVLLLSAARIALSIEVSEDDTNLFAQNSIVC